MLSPRRALTCCFRGDEKWLVWTNLKAAADQLTKILDFRSLKHTSQSHFWGMTAEDQPL